MRTLIFFFFFLLFFFSPTVASFHYTFFNITGKLSCTATKNPQYSIFIWEADSIKDDLIACCGTKHGECFNQTSEYDATTTETIFNVFTGDWHDMSPHFELYIEIFHNCNSDELIKHTRRFGYYPANGSTHQLHMNLNMDLYGVPIDAEDLLWTFGSCPPKSNLLSKDYDEVFYESFHWVKEALRTTTTAEPTEPPFVLIQPLPNLQQFLFSYLFLINGLNTTDTTLPDWVESVSYSLSNSEKIMDLTTVVDVDTMDSQIRGLARAFITKFMFAEDESLGEIVAVQELLDKLVVFTKMYEKCSPKMEHVLTYVENKYYRLQQNRVFPISKVKELFSKLFNSYLEA